MKERLLWCRRKGREALKVEERLQRWREGEGNNKGEYQERRRRRNRINCKSRREVKSLEEREEEKREKKVRKIKRDEGA